MSQDLSQAFGRPATSSLRGLLPPRDGRTRWSDPSDEAPRPEPEDLEAAGFGPGGFEDDEPEDGELEDGELEDEDGEPQDDEPEAPPAAPERVEGPRQAARRTPAASGRRTAPATTAPTTAAAPARSRRGPVRVTSRDQVDLLVLLALRRGPADGRGVIARLRETSGGTLDVPERTVHVTLHRLARNRLLGRRLGPVSGRRLYALTEAGQRAGRARLREWQALARGVDAVSRSAE